jgi:hypothetical protein
VKNVLRTERHSLGKTVTNLIEPKLLTRFRKNRALLPFKIWKTLIYMYIPPGRRVKILAKIFFEALPSSRQIVYRRLTSQDKLTTESEVSIRFFCSTRGQTTHETRPGTILRTYATLVTCNFFHLLRQSEKAICHFDDVHSEPFFLSMVLFKRMH